MYKIVFFGTPEFSLPALGALRADERFSIELVVTQPAKPVGREKEVTDSPVAAYAKTHNLELATPESVRRDADFIARIIAMKPDFIVVVAYGKIIPNELLAAAKFGAINIHPSALPKYRGASPLQASIASCNAETAVTIMLMDADVDHGPILVQILDTINTNDTSETLGARLFEKAAQVLPETMSQLAEGKLTPKTQNDADATFTKLIDRVDGKVNFEKSARLIDAKRRAFTPWPGIYIELGDGMIIKLLATNPVASCKGFVPGALHAHEKELHAATADGCLRLDSVQPAGKSAMNASAFLNGYQRYLSTK
jgi:methionyl-tRNA formyltransferase